MLNPDIIDSLSRLHEYHFGATPTLVTPLKGDGSDRQLFRLFSDADEPVIGVYGPNRRENEAFISFSRTLQLHAIPVPRIHAYDAEAKIYLESDLGDVTLLEWCVRHSDDTFDACRSIYQQVISWMPEIQLEIKESIDYTKCHPFAAFGREAMQFDLDYFRSSFLSRFLRIEPDSAALAHDFDVLISHLLRAPFDAFMYRDFQSKNIMIRDEQPSFIDYQSGRKGALQYDVASLLFDANVDLTPCFREEMLEFYLDRISKYTRISSGQFRLYYYDFALLRMLQALAAFSFLVFQKGKSYFMASIPHALQNITFLLMQDDCIVRRLPELRRLFEEDLLIHVPLDTKRALS